MIITRVLTILLLSVTTLKAQQQILGKRINDAILQLGTEYTRVQDGPVTKLRYAPSNVDHPTFGRFSEADQYDFLNDVCEARHAYIPASLEQEFIDDFNKKFGKGDHLWRGDNDTYIAIKDRGERFELMVWTPVYEEMLDNK